VELLKSMGYPHPKGYVWYLKYNEIVPVVKWDISIFRDSCNSIR
jgi:hypothetical protein